MSTDHWLAVTREDGEAVGYLDPVTSDYGEVIPRNRLGHAVADVLHYHQAEELVLNRGLRELAAPWLLDGTGDPLTPSCRRTGSSCATRYAARP
jgi:hypothetical protein